MVLLNMLPTLTGNRAGYDGLTDTVHGRNLSVCQRTSGSKYPNFADGLLVEFRHFVPLASWEKIGAQMRGVVLAARRTFRFGVVSVPLASSRASVQDGKRDVAPLRVQRQMPRIHAVSSPAPLASVADQEAGRVRPIEPRIGHGMGSHGPSVEPELAVAVGGNPALPDEALIEVSRNLDLCQPAREVAGRDGFRARDRAIIRLHRVPPILVAMPPAGTNSAGVSCENCTRSLQVEVA